MLGATELAVSMMTRQFSSHSHLLFLETCVFKSAQSLTLCIQPFPCDWCSVSLLLREVGREVFSEEVSLEQILSDKKNTRHMEISGNAEKKKSQSPEVGVSLTSLQNIKDKEKMKSERPTGARSRRAPWP